MRIGHNKNQLFIKTDNVALEAMRVGWGWYIEVFTKDGFYSINTTGGLKEMFKEVRTFV